MTLRRTCRCEEANHGGAFLTMGRVTQLRRMADVPWLREARAVGLEAHHEAFIPFEDCLDC